MPWKLDDHLALWTAEPVTIRIDPGRLRGAAEGPFGKFDFWRLACDHHDERADWRVVESFVRGRELAARYERDACGRNRCDLRWRIVPPSNDDVLLCLEWLLSWQTFELDDRLDCLVTTNVPASKQWLCQESCRPIDAPTVVSDRPVRAVATAWGGSGGYVELLWPSDFERVAVRPQGERTTIEWRLTEPHLEKGVIRRVRFRSYLLRSPVTPERIEACLREFAASSTPLTA